jgi:hypothetical protein
MINNAHDDLSVFNCKGGLFDTGMTVLHQNVQRVCRFTQKLQNDPKHGSIIVGTEWRIIGVQKTYQGNLAYRVKRMGADGCFGRVAHPDDIEFID